MSKYSRITTGLLLLIFCSLSSINVFAQNSELTITTNIMEAREIFIEGRTNLENVNINKAAALFDKAIKMDQNFALAHLFRSITNVGGFDVSRKHLDIAVDRTPFVSSGEIDLILFQKAQSDGDQVKQKVYLNNMLTAFPNDKRVHLIAGNFFRGLSETKTAIKHYNKSIKIDRNYAPVYNSLGYAHSSLENYSDAEKAFKKYIQLIPDNPNPYDSYAELLMKRGRYNESIKQYEKAYNVDKTFLNALTGIGHNHSFKGDNDKARMNYNMVYNKAVNVNQKLASLYWTATSYVHEGNIDGALSTIEKQRKLARKNNLTTNIIGTYNLEGFVLTESGNPAKGIEKFRTASKIIEGSKLPTNVKEGYQLRNGLNMCYALTANNQIEAAEDEALICTKMVNERSNPGEKQNLHGTLALLEMKKGNYKTAIKHFQKTNLINTPYNWYKMAVAYDKMGNKTMATKYYDKAGNSNINNIGFALIRDNVKE